MVIVSRLFALLSPIDENQLIVLYMKISNEIRSSRLFKFFYEILTWVRQRRDSLRGARRHFKTEKPKVGSYADFKKANWKHRVTYSEYMYGYEYWKLNEAERDEFISASEMRCIYRKFGNIDVRDVFHDKVEFLKKFQSFIHRCWALASELSQEQFKSMIMQYDCIAKPIGGTQGAGIFKIQAAEVKDWDALYSRCVKENMLIEECIQACDEMAAFHPSSLNTIRVVTFSGQNGCEIFGALFRMGAHGSVVDNTHAGGIYAPINVETGTIDTDAIDAQNHHYPTHPDTNQPIKGFKIPCWQKIIETCKTATQTIPNIHFAGWDLCVTKDGEVEIIEGNHAPDFDGGMQAPLKIGVKKKVQQTMLKVMGIDPLDYISVWKY